MKKLERKIVSGLLALCMMTSILCTAAFAEENRSSLYLNFYSATTTTQRGGMVTVTVDVSARAKMTKVGASSIYLYESRDGGVNYKCVKTFEYQDYPLMMGSGMSHYEDAVTYKGTPGYYYYANVYVYAGDSTGYDEKMYSTTSVKAF